jgi:hypothetical protein
MIRASLRIDLDQFFSHSVHKYSRSGMILFPSVRASAPGVARTGEPGIELGQFLFQEKTDVLTYGAFRHPIHSDPLSLQFHQGSHPDASNCHRIHLSPSQSFQRLAHSMRMVQVVVVDFLNGPGLRIDDDKTGGRPEVPIHPAFQAFKITGGKTNLHAVVPFSLNLHINRFDSA